MIHAFDGQEYRRAGVHQRLWGVDFADSIALRGDEIILDLGCGDGVVTAALAARVPRGSVLGVDASESMIATATEGAGANLAFAIQDVTSMTYAGEFDIVFSHAALHWVSDHGRLLDAIHRALRPGGRAELNIASEGACPALEGVLRSAMADPQFIEHFAGFVWPWTMPSESHYAELLTASQFDDFEVIPEERTRVFDTLEALIRWLEQPILVPFLAGLPLEQHRAFQDRVIRQMGTETALGSGRYLERFRRIHIRACR